MQINSRQATFFILLSSLFAVVYSGGALAQTVPGCGELRGVGQYGPYDARKDLDKLPIVLGAHFTPQVEALIKGSSGTVGADLDYTLRAIPNYHRALLSMIRLGNRSKIESTDGSRFSVECWLKRAVAFAPDDAIVRMIYSSFLNTKGRVAEGSEQLSVATVLAKDNPFTHYNIGLHYLDLKDYENALSRAHKALALGFLQTELKDQLVNAGKWREPVYAEPEASTPTAANNSLATEPADTTK